MKVTLNWYEQSMAAHVAQLRHIRAIGRNVRQDGTVPTWDEEVEGAHGEAAVAKCLGVWWSGSVDNFDGPDLHWNGLWVHVRWAQENGCLIVRPHDKAGLYFLVTGRRGDYEVHGWIDRDAARRDEFVRDPHGWGKAWFVPAARLEPVEDLAGRRAA